MSISVTLVVFYNLLQVALLLNFKFIYFFYLNFILKL